MLTRVPAVIVEVPEHNEEYLVHIYKEVSFVKFNFGKAIVAYFLCFICGSRKLFSMIDLFFPCSGFSTHSPDLVTATHSILMDYSLMT